MLSTCCNILKSKNKEVEKMRPVVIFQSKQITIFSHQHGEVANVKPYVNTRIP